MNKKNLIIIISMVVIASIIGGIFLFLEQKNKPNFAPENANVTSVEVATTTATATTTVSSIGQDEQKHLKEYCAALRYMTLDLKFYAHVKCDYLDMCAYYDIENAMKWMKEKYGSSLPKCGQNFWTLDAIMDSPALGDYNASLYYSEVYLTVTNDLYEIIKDQLNQKITLDSELSFILTKAPDEVEPYLANDKYCERDSDCIITGVGCTRGSYNKYSERIYWPIGCETGIMSLRSVSNSMYYDEKFGDYVYKTFQTTQLGCINGRCEEKYILDETGEEF